MSEVQNFQQRLAAERAQLLAHWSKVFNTRPCLAEKPFTQLTKLLHEPPQQNKTDMWLRQFHNKFGWMAKGAVRTGGLCAGAIYRTRAFIELDQQSRIGSKIGQTVHIEHTVPISELRDQWENRPKQRAGIPAAKDAYTWILANSVTTAFRVYEISHLSGYHRRTDCYVPTADWFGKPFMRYGELYKNDGEVWNVLTGELIEISKFTFEDHVRTLRSLGVKAGAAPDFFQVE